MGLYINQDSKGVFLPANGKTKALVTDGTVVQTNPHYVPGKSVCVVENFSFDAAAYAFSQREFDEFFNDHSGRRKTFLEYDHALELAK